MRRGRRWNDRSCGGRGLGFVRGGGRAIGADQLGRKMTTSQYGQHAIGDPIRQWIRPLVDGLIGDADCIGGRGGASAQQFDGFRFEHATLNHSSEPCATIVTSGPLCFADMDPDTYAWRLARAMGVDAKTPPEKRKALVKSLASALGVTTQAVEKYFNATSNALSARNNAKAARHLRVDPDWLATGEGGMHSARAWPFGDQLTPEQFYSLDATAVQPALDILKAALARQQLAPNHDVTEAQLAKLMQSAREAEQERVRMVRTPNAAKRGRQPPNDDKAGKGKTKK